MCWQGQRGLAGSHPSADDGAAETIKETKIVGSSPLGQRCPERKPNHPQEDLMGSQGEPQWKAGPGIEEQGQG
jgi:hypothetical protein